MILRPKHFFIINESRYNMNYFLTDNNIMLYSSVVVMLKSSFFQWYQYKTELI